MSFRLRKVRSLNMETKELHLTEGETVALFDLIHEHFGYGRKYHPVVCDEDLKVALNKLREIRSEFYED